MSSRGSTAPAGCSSDPAAVGTYDFMLGNDDGWTAIVLRSDCRYCFANGQNDQASRELHAGDGVWSSATRADGTLGVSLNHDALVLTLDPKAGTIDLTAMKLTLHRDGDGFTCDGATVTR